MLSPLPPSKDGGKLPLHCAETKDPPNTGLAMPLPGDACVGGTSTCERQVACSGLTCIKGQYHLFFSSSECLLVSAPESRKPCKQPVRAEGLCCQQTLTEQDCAGTSTLEGGRVVTPVLGGPDLLQAVWIYTADFGATNNPNRLRSQLVGLKDYSFVVTLEACSSQTKPAIPMGKI